MKKMVAKKGNQPLVFLQERTWQSPTKLSERPSSTQSVIVEGHIRLYNTNKPNSDNKRSYNS